MIGTDHGTAKTEPPQNELCAAFGESLSKVVLITFQSRHHGKSIAQRRCLEE